MKMKKFDLKKTLQFLAIAGIILIIISLLIVNKFTLLIIGCVLIAPYIIFDIAKSTKKKLKTGELSYIDVIFMIAFPSTMILSIITVKILPNYANYMISLFLIVLISTGIKNVIKPLGLKDLILSYIILMLTIIFVMGGVYSYYDHSSKQGYIKFGECNNEFNIDDPNKSTNYFYFSTVTLFSLGYGDICPMGKSRIVAGIEVFLGHFVTVIAIAFGIGNLKNAKSKNTLQME